MKKNKFLSLIALVSVGAIFLSNCGPETVEAPKPIVNFLADAKYVSANSALAASTDFTIGLTATHSSTLSTLTITKAVNGGAAVIEKEEELSEEEKKLKDKEINERYKKSSTKSGPHINNC